MTNGKLSPTSINQTQYRLILILAKILAIASLFTLAYRAFAGEFVTLRDIYHDDVVRISIWTGVISSLSGLFIFSARTRNRHKIPVLILDAIGRQYQQLNNYFAKPWRVHAIFAPLALLQILMLVLCWNELPWMSNDSWEYIGFAPWRTLGYPLVLRLVALISSQPQAVIAVQLTVTIIVTYFFVETVRRSFRNGIMTFLVGISLFASWPWFYYSYVFLPEQLFFSALTLFLSFCILTFHNPQRRHFLGIAISAALCIFIRPAGIFIIFTIPFFYLYFSQIKLRLSLFFLLPFAVLLSTQILTNKLVFKYAALTNFTGVAVVPNTLYLLKPGVQTNYTSLVKKLTPVAETYRQQLKLNFRNKQEFDFARNAFVPMTFIPVKITSDYLLSTNVKDEVDNPINWFENSSYLNQVYTRISNTSRPNWKLNYVSGYLGELNRILTEISIDIHLGNIREAVMFTFWKVFHGWREVIPFFSMPANLGPHQILDIDRTEGSYIRTQRDKWFDKGVRGITVRVFDTISAVPFIISVLMPLPLLVLISGIISGLFYFQTLFKSRKVSPNLVVPSFAALCLFLYHIEVAVTHIGLTRYLTMGIPFAVLLAFWPLSFIKAKEPSQIPEDHEI